MRAEILVERKRCETEYTLPKGFSFKDLDSVILTDPVGNMMTLSAAKVRKGWRVFDYIPRVGLSNDEATLYVEWVYSS